MKKSFLNRVAAAAIAVPVALTQTVMFTSFADGETATKIDIDTFVAIAADGDRLVKIDESNVSAYEAKEVKNENAYVQESTWNTKVKTTLNSMTGYSYEMNAQEVLDNLDNNSSYADLIRAAADKDTLSGTVEFNRNNIVVTVNATLNVAKALQGVADEQNADVTFENEDFYDVTFTMTADISNLANEKKIPFNVVISGESNPNASAQDIVDYIQERFNEIKAHSYAEIEGDPDEAKMETKLDKLFGQFENKVNNAQNYLNKAKTNRTFAYTAENADELYAAAYADGENSRFSTSALVFDGKTLDINDIPATLDEALASKYYESAAKYFNKAIEITNKKIASTGNEFAITDQDVVDFVKSGSDFEVNGETVNLTTTDHAFFYIPDEDADLTVYTEYFNAILAADDLKVKDIYSVKAVEANAEADANDWSGAGDLNIYRVVWYTTQDIDATEPDTTEPNGEDDTTEPTGESDTNEPTGESDTDVTEPTGESDTDATEPTGESDTDVTEPTGESDTDATEPTGESDTDATEPTGESDTKEPTDVADTVEVDMTAIAGFYFSHDPNAFDASELITSASVVAEDGTATVVTDFSAFTFGYDKTGAVEGLNPQAMYAERPNTSMYDVRTLNVYYNGKLAVDKDGNALTVTVYIGVKGDVNNDGITNAADATDILLYAAAKGAGVEDAYLLSAEDATLERFAFFLGDTDTESTEGAVDGKDVTAADASNVLIYSAIMGANNNKCDWVPEVLGTTNLPKYSEAIAKKAGLID